MYQKYTKEPGIAHALYRKIWLIMRLTTVLLIATLMQLSAATFGQRITMNQQNVPLKTLFKEIRKQSGFNFFYDGKVISPDLKSSIQVSNVSVEEALKTVLANLPLSYKIEDKLIIITKKPEPSILENVIARFQTIDVKGKVVDEKGEPLPRASIKVKKKNIGTTADLNGNFSMSSLDDKDVLIISYLGYEKREVSVAGDMGDIALKLSESILDQVQIQAYGTTTRRLSTGNITTISAKDIEKRPINNPLLALAGIVPGLTITQTSGLPGAPVNVQLRGQNSLSRSSDRSSILPTQPLFIVDGLPYNNNIPALGGPLGRGTLGGTMSAFNFISPNDIESIEVLKDADATAIYGSRGANGVILITTKKGEAGSMKLDVNLQTGLGHVTREMKLMNTSQYLEMRREALVNDKVDLSSIPEIVKTIRYPDLFVYDSQRNTNWQRELIGGTANYTDLQTSFTGGTANTKYLLGGNYHKETTVFPGQSGDNKANVHLNITSNSADNRFKSLLSVSYMSNWTDFPREDFTQFVTLAPNSPTPFLEDGSVNWNPVTIDGNKIYTFSANPLNRLRQPYSSKVNNITASGELSYRLLSSLVFKTTLGYNELNGNSYIAVNPFSSLLNPSIFDLRESQFNQTYFRSVIIEPQVTYSANVLKGTLDLLLGSTYQNNNNEGQDIIAQGFSDDALMSNPGSATNTQLSSFSSQYKYSALFGRMSYNYNGKYLLNINARRDGSSRFGPGNQFGNFGSIGGAWIFTEESFIRNSLKSLSFGKLRYSYGISGNDGIGDYNYIERYTNSEGSYQNVKGLRAMGLYNPFYAWETTRKQELGLDLGFLSDRVVLQTSYYHNISADQLIDYPFPSMSGYGNLIVNSKATIQNTGWDITLNTKNIINTLFKWSTSFNISANRNKLLKFPGLESSPYYQYYRIGQPVDRINVFKFGGVNSESGTYQFVGRNGELTNNPLPSYLPENDLTSFVQLSPKFFGGISNSVSFKSFSLDFLFQFVKQTGKNYLFSFLNTPGTLGNDRLNNQPFEVLARWRTLGNITSIQKFSQNYSLSDAYNYSNQSDAAYSDASFIRLKNISLSYTLPEAWKNKLKVRNCRIFLHGQNLLTITKYKGLDPENQSVLSLPPLRTITSGIQVTF